MYGMLVPYFEMLPAASCNSLETLPLQKQLALLPSGMVSGKSKDRDKRHLTDDAMEEAG